MPEKILIILVHPRFENFQLQEELQSQDLKQDLSRNDHAWDSREKRKGLNRQ
jgi:hypothetical protein